MDGGDTGHDGVDRQDRTETGCAFDFTLMRPAASDEYLLSSASRMRGTWNAALQPELHGPTKDLLRA